MAATVPCRGRSRVGRIPYLSPLSGPARAARKELGVRHVSKFFGNVIALKDVSCLVGAGQVTCVLGDNGAVKPTFIKILSGVHQHSEGEFLVEGEPVRFKPRLTRALRARRETG